MDKKVAFIIEHNGVKYCGLEIHNNGHEIICYGNNKLFMLFDRTSEVFYDEKTDSEVNGEIEFAGIIVDYCVMPEYDKLLNTIEL